MSSGASNFVQTTDAAFLFIVAISVFLLVVVTFLMIFFVIKYNKKRNAKAVNIHGNVPLEITWTVVPTLLVLVMFWFGWVGYKQISDIPKNTYNINVTAQMWQWKFHYNNGLQTDTLYVPLEVPVKLNLKSLDVNHALFIPAFRIKKNVYANRENTIWFEPEQAGSYTLTCAQYCGLDHSYMHTQVVVLPRAEFNDWFRKASAAKNTQGSPKDSSGASKDSTKVKS